MARARMRQRAQPRRGRGGARVGEGRGRAVRACDRAPRKPPHRQSAARPFGAPGRPRPVEILPLSRRRLAAHLRSRHAVFQDDEQESRGWRGDRVEMRTEENTSELQTVMRISYAVFCLKKKM